jgi:prepilin-type N-terminal cleavage/methylation domain-containing protein
MLHPSRQQGFTLIEMIVSLGVFSVVITISVGALLMLVATNKQLQGEQSVMTNLSFALDSMTREIRTGTHYYCDTAPNTSAGGSSNIFNDSHDVDSILYDSVTGQKNQDCSNGAPGGHKYRGLAFIEGGNSITAGNDRILYYFNKNDGKIYRRVGAQASESIVSSGIYIKDFQFFVSGSEPLSAGATKDDQPSVTIYIEATESSDPAAKSYYIETTVTQRTLDL